MNPYFSKIAKSIKNKANPHNYLGLQGDNTVVQFSPNMKENTILVDGEKKEMELADSRGYFIYTSEYPLSVTDYEVIHSDGTVGHDPYSLTPSLSLVDIHLFDKGLFCSTGVVARSRYRPIWVPTKCFQVGEE